MTAPHLVSGWYREPGDPTVGIFSHFWWHEGCKVVEPFDISDPKECLESVENVGAEGEGGDRFDLLRYIVTCQDCGATYSFTEREWNPDYPEDGE